MAHNWFRFSIKDICWATLVVALICGWFLHSQSWKRFYIEKLIKWSNERMAVTDDKYKELDKLQKQINQLIDEKYPLPAQDANKGAAAESPPE